MERTVGGGAGVAWHLHCSQAWPWQSGRRELSEGVPATIASSALPLLLLSRPNGAAKGVAVVWGRGPTLTSKEKGRDLSLTSGAGPSWTGFWEVALAYRQAVPLVMRGRNMLGTKTCL